ncbi:helix-turn-helix domain-containing protein [Sphingobacterium sp. UDSM-2020]|uniref:helix-turn-helix domain-containing protein n=1 Tax=Sphingobacterium sp. UDSM-2020 TaxID=2795738 RepID=UPI0019365814|nr:helix-turn-helix transcriptional regulator [Sphingobacterium sp. UDSM-2020]MBV2228495.1 helix-turn-helix transcriptional regulator [Sphingobacterium mizutaii]QQD14398.1 helix-turn-helix transcriptional regulator [Sphingobacterium sp. UDSM-2020]
MATRKDFTEIDLEIEQRKIGIRFRQIRKSLGYTSHEAFAYDHDLDRSQYGKIETGKYNLTLRVLVRVLNAIKLSFSEFFNEEYDDIELEK